MGKIKNFFAANKENIKQIVIVSFTIIALSLMLGVVMVAMTVVPSDWKLIKVVLSDSKVILLNSWPLLCVMAILYFATGRTWISFAVTGVLSLIITEINRLKITYRDEPFVFSDILLVGEAGEMSKQYKIFFDKGTFAALAVIVLFSLLAFFFIRFKPTKRLVRIFGAVLCVVILVLSCNTYYFNNSEIYNSTWHKEMGNKWKTANQYMSRGAIYSFVRSIPNVGIKAPEGYKKSVAKDIMSRYSDIDLADGKKVNIISIMLEAYNDFSVFDGIEFNIDPYENFHLLQKDAYSGKLYTNIFSAGTIDTERAFLTGYNKTTINKKNTNSFVRYFKNQGYYTEAMHCGYGWFYDRKNINAYLGFDNFDCVENKYGEIPKEEKEVETYHGLLSDWDFFDYIIEGYEKALAKNQKYFNFSVTYQNHGPYMTGKHLFEDYVVRREEYTTAEYNIFNNYIYGIYKTDKALGKLREYIDLQQEPIVLILFGDHNPWLGDGNSVYKMFDINLNLETKDGGENYYQTPYVFYANEAAKESLGKDFSGQGNTVSPMLLMCEYFEYIGSKGSAYLNYLSELKKEYEVINTVFVGKDGEYALTVDQAENALLKEQKNIEYYLKKEKIK